MSQKLLPTLFISLSLCGAARTVALDQPRQPAPAKAGYNAATDTAAAIRALGPNATKRQVSSIVFQAVRSSPGDVLFIVHAAARVAPKATVPEIVTAAVAAVPNPWKRVAYRRTAKKSDPNYKGGPDGKSGPDGKGGFSGGRNVDLGGRQPGDPRAGTASGNLATGDANGPGGFGTTVLPGGPGYAGALGDFGAFGDPGAFSDPGAFGDPGAFSDPGSFGDPSDPAFGGNAADSRIVTLAEAIAFAAFGAQPGLNFPDLQTAVNIALLTDPASLLRDVQSSRSISGVGDSGLSNYANEPLRTPVQPAVSR